MALVVAVGVAAVAAALVALLWLFQRSLIYLPASQPVPPAATVVAGAQDVRLQTSDGLTLGAWYVPARRPGPGVAVLVANGNAGNRAVRAPLARALAERGLSVLLFDYRGYGGNPGRPSEEGLARDVRAARQFLVEQAGFVPERLVYYGESLGAAVVTELATDHPPGGMLLRSPFADLVSVGKVHYPFLPVGTLLKDRFPLVAHLKEVRVPTSVVYGTQDRIVPPEQSRAVARAAPVLVRLVPVEQAHHNDRVLLDGAPVVDAVVELAQRIQ
jgi:pimeloyl-ACP methyl ester carboxylesterase